MTVNAKPTAASTVYEAIRQDILSGSLSPGQHLTIEFLMDRYAAGANPIREALNRLSVGRLLDRRDQRGFFVSPVSVEDVRELVTTRCWVETRALTESIRNRTVEWEEGLVLAFHRLSRAPIEHGETQTVSSPRWEAAHQAFHHALLSNCGSSWLTEFCHHMMDHAKRYRAIADVADVRLANNRDTLSEHRGILEAALDGDADLAAERLVAHYETTFTLLAAGVSRGV